MDCCAGYPCDNYNMKREKNLHKISDVNTKGCGEKFRTPLVFEGCYRKNSARKTTAGIVKRESTVDNAKISEEYV